MRYNIFEQMLPVNAVINALQSPVYRAKMHRRIAYEHKNQKESDEWRQGIDLRSDPADHRSHEKRAEQLGVKHIYVSISHEKEYAVAFVILEN